MMLYVIRHATAEAGGGGADVDRRLTAKGRGEALRAGVALRKLGATPGIILSSPALRAIETAELIAEGLSAAPAVETRGALYGEGGPGELLKLLTPFPDQSVVLVGHMPDVGQLVAAVAGAAVSFSPSTVCCLEIQGEEGRLIWHRTPNELAAVAENP